MQEYEEDEKVETRHRKSNTVSLTDCLQLFTEPETLSQEEAWWVCVERGERERGDRRKGRRERRKMRQDGRMCVHTYQPSSLIIKQ